MVLTEPVHGFEIRGLNNRKRGIIIMGMTMTQKILAAHAGLPSVEAGQLIMADLDLVLAMILQDRLLFMRFRS